MKALQKGYERVQIDDFSDRDIAIIGMACRFPGANTIEQYWHNLKNGIESISSFSVEELRAHGVSPTILTNPHYVRARGIIEGIEDFDAAFFGLTPREAEILDPQQRLLFECAWEALESAGYNPRTYQQMIGFYAGTTLSSYYLHNILGGGDTAHTHQAFQISLGNEPNFVTTRISYKFNLRGPSISINTACSTSLVATHLACQSLLLGECDMSLAGGSSVMVPQKSGYLYEPDGIASPDGHCRAFDANANGTVSGNGAGIVLLKRMEDAVKDGDTIYAVIRGTAINNDGSTKVGFAAPSQECQARVIAEALSVAEVDAETISYVETHGTGTPLGDMIELSALSQAFGDRHGKSCAIGSVKTNIGHLDAGAGVAGLIKVALALYHKQLPPSLHYTSPHPLLHLNESPFYVNTTVLPWETETLPRRAGVSSFGIGGTNAHVVLEEFIPDASVSSAHSWHLIPLSATTQGALETVSKNLVAHLQHYPEVPLADVAYTTQCKDHGFLHRKYVIGQTSADVIKELQYGGGSQRSLPMEEMEKAKSVIFLFPGQGTQYINMGRELYQEEGPFKTFVDRCAEILEPYLGTDIREILYPSPDRTIEAEKILLEQAAIAQSMLFTVEYALARMWMSFGVTPSAMLGHSIGELVCACLAGVFSLPDALKLIAIRGKLTQCAPDGAMLSVLLPEKDVIPLLEADISLAAINLPSLCVVSGATQAIEHLQERLKRADIGCHRLPIARAFHTPHMGPELLTEFLSQIQSFPLSEPSIPYLSNVTGTWITPEEAMDPQYWTQHLSQTVRFASGLLEIICHPNNLLLEVGPGQTLGAFARLHPDRNPSQEIYASMRYAQDKISDSAMFLQGLGYLWLAGVLIRWSPLYANEQRRRISLPTYPLERQRYWIEPAQSTMASLIAPSQEPLVSENIQAREINEEARMNEQPSVGQSARKQNIHKTLRAIIKDLSGIEPTDEDTYVTFLDRGLDSLFLLEISDEISSRLNVQVALRQLFEELSTLDAIADYIDQLLPPEEPVLPEATIVEPASASPDRFIPIVEGVPVVEPSPVEDDAVADSSIEGTLEKIVNRQLDLMAEQLQLLRQYGAQASLPPSVSKPTNKEAEDVSRKIRQETEQAMPDNKIQTNIYVPFKPNNRDAVTALSPQQQSYLDQFIQVYTKQTQGSKEHNQSYRRFLADPRVSFGFKQRWKDLVYPIVAKNSSGGSFWDVDGNKYIDFAMGFGVHLFGHSPVFVREAIEEQMEQGMQLGPQTYLAGKVARELCEMVGMERAMFCNSGTEAVMASLRIARTVTRRSKVVIFKGSFHGTFDGTMARAIKTDNEEKVVPQVPGILAKMVEDVILLDYDVPASLTVIKEHAHELAAVLVEPVQSRRPDIQPKAFLQELRQITKAEGIALIFDEMITGFRIHQRGAQAYFDVQADIVTYGKVIGGGMPIGIIAGMSKYMDALDGGFWQYGDSSYPPAIQTAFAGTFCKHPLAMAAAYAVITRLKKAGNALQDDLNEKTERLVSTLNQFFEHEQVPIRMVHCGSLFDFEISIHWSFSDLFFYLLVHKGIYIWEGRTCFLSTAHTQEDCDYLFQMVKETIGQLRQGGFLPPFIPQNDSSMQMIVLQPTAAEKREPLRHNGESEGVLTAPLTSMQQQIWAACQSSEESNAAYNECDALVIRGACDIEALQRTLQHLVNRHDALRSHFSAIGDHQYFPSTLSIAVPFADIGGLGTKERESYIAKLLDDEAHEPFDLRKGPLFRTRIVRCQDQEHLLVLTMHHLIVDAWSYNVLVEELCTIYVHEVQQQPWQLAPVMQFSKYAKQVAQAESGADVSKSEQYWLAQFADSVPRSLLPTDYPRGAINTYQGNLITQTLPNTLCQALKTFSAQTKATLYMTLLAAFEILLHGLLDQDDLVVGNHIAGQAMLHERSLVGCCINVLPFRSRIKRDMTFKQHVLAVRNAVFDAYAHANYTLGQIEQKLKLPTEQGRSFLVPIAFNLDFVGTSASLPGISIEPVPGRHVSAKWELSVNIVQGEEDLLVECIYASNLFKEDTIQNWLELFRVLLQIILAEPEIRLEQLLLRLAEEQEHQMAQVEEAMQARRSASLKTVRRKAVQFSSEERSSNV